MPEISSEVRELFERHPWEDAIPRLVKYALDRIRRLKWQGAQGGEPFGRAAEDFVFIAIQKVLSGERSWDPQRYPDLTIHLMGIIKSEISHFVESQENRCIRTEATLNSNTKEGPIDNTPSSIPSPREALINAELEKEAEEFLWGFLDFLSDDQPLTKMVECIVYGFAKPRDVAEALRVDISEVYNMRKQLRRRLRDYQINDKNEKMRLAEGGKSHG